jgi:Leucine-rich repeat (LRR) protein
MLVAFVLIAIWVALLTNRVRTQKVAVNRATQLGAGVAFDFMYDSDTDTWKKNPKRLAPEWFINFMGEDFFRKPVIVNFSEGSNPNDDDLQVVSTFHALEQLTLDNQKNITDEGLRALKDLTKLEVLGLQGTNLTGVGLKYLPKCPNMRLLTLDRSQCSDEGLKYLRNFPELKWLFLSNTQITDDGLRELSALRKLQDLQIVGTAITDEGAKHLAEIPTLTRLLLRDTKISADGLRWLRAQLPNCRIQ